MKKSKITGSKITGWISLLLVILWFVGVFVSGSLGSPLYMVLLIFFIWFAHKTLRKGYELTKVELVAWLILAFFFSGLVGIFIIALGFYLGLLILGLLIVVSYFILK